MKVVRRITIETHSIKQIKTASAQRPSYCVNCGDPILVADPQHIVELFKIEPEKISHKDEPEQPESEK